MDNEYVYTERFYQCKITNEDILILNYGEFMNKQVNKLTALKMAKNKIEKYDHNGLINNKRIFMIKILEQYGITGKMSREEQFNRCKFKSFPNGLFVTIDGKYIGAFIFNEEVISKLDNEYTEVEYTIKFIENYKED